MSNEPIRKGSLMRYGVLFLTVVCSLLPLSCGSAGATLFPASQDPADTLAETTVLLFQWVNTLDVRTEFDFQVDDQTIQHIELPARSSVNLRLTGNCPQQVNFFNVEFGDEFFAGFIPFVQGGFAGEGDLAAEGGDFQPATFFCFSSWQLTVNDSNIDVSALDRQANSTDEGEVNVSDVLSLDDAGNGTTQNPFFLRTPPDPTSTSSSNAPRSSSNDNGADSTGGISSPGNASGLRGPSSGS